MSVLTTHENPSGNTPIGLSMNVADTIKNYSALVTNDVIPESYNEAVLGGIENTATTMSSAGNDYTVIPIYPVNGNVLDVSKSFINNKFEITFTVADGTSGSSLDTDTFGVYLNTSAMLPNRVELLCGNSTIWSTNYQREEAMVMMNSLPQSIIKNNANFSLIENIQPDGVFCGTFIPSKAGDVVRRLETNIDLDFLTPLLSAFKYIVPEMGPLRIKLHFENIEKAFSWCAYGTSTTIKAAVREALPCGKSAFILTNGAVSKSVSIKSWKAYDEGVQIHQSIFSINQTSHEAIKAFIAGQGNHFTIPTQTFNTTIATTQPLTITTAGTSQAQFNWELSTYNIAMIAFLFPFKSSSQSYYPHPRFEYITIELGGRSVTPTPYKYVDQRCMKVTNQALTNDDEYSVNTNLYNSLHLQPAGCLAMDDTAKNTAYESIYKLDVTTPTFNLYLHPNTFLIAQTLQPVGSFQKGKFIANGNRASTQMRFIAANPNIAIYEGENTPGVSPAILGWYKEGKVNDSPAPIAVCLLDCCVVMIYNPASQTCQSGNIVYSVANKPTS